MRFLCRLFPKDRPFLDGRVDRSILSVFIKPVQATVSSYKIQCSATCFCGNSIVEEIASLAAPQQLVTKETICLRFSARTNNELRFTFSCSSSLYSMWDNIYLRDATNGKIYTTIKILCKHSFTHKFHRFRLNFSRFIHFVFYVVRKQRQAKQSCKIHKDRVHSCLRSERQTQYHYIFSEKMEPFEFQRFLLTCLGRRLHSAS